MSLKADIFNIERASLSDGPGVRTVVYIKGCSLSCKWCHNPEGINFGNEIAYYANRCVLCGTCMTVCQKKCYDVSSDKLKIDYNRCTKCNTCVDSCPTNALKLCAESMNADEVFDEILKDKAYYDKSGGGVTFSGGECLLNTEFMYEILKKCKTKNIHTLVESAFCIPWKNIEKIVPLVDIFYIDIKHMNSEIHKTYTGCGNELILENIKKLSDITSNILIRIPLIPDVNDDNKNIIDTYNFVRKCGLSNIMLLPYNDLGAGKYIALGRESYKTKKEPLSNKEVNEKCDFLNQKIGQNNFFVMH